MKQWHAAKLVVLWLIGMPVSIQLLHTGRNVMNQADSVHVALGLISFAIAVPATLLLLTWRWLGAREVSPRSRP